MLLQHDSSKCHGSCAVPHVELHPSDRPAVTLSHVCMERNGRTVLDDANLTVHKGDFVAITGPNGGGKTTMLRIILGLLTPTSGTVRLDVGRNSIGYLPQKNSVDSHFPISVREVVASGLLGVRDMDAAARLRAVNETLRRIEMEDMADRPIGRLSGGQLQRTLLGRAIVSHPALLVLDEPLSYIDKHFESHIYTLLAGMAPHCTILLVSHEMSAIASMANRHILVDRTVSECPAHHHYIHTECL